MRFFLKRELSSGSSGKGRHWHVPSFVVSFENRFYSWKFSMVNQVLLLLSEVSMAIAVWFATAWVRRRERVGRR